jgi:hypothetical protein
MNTELLNRAIENAGPMGDAQRRAMWAKRGSPASAPRAAGARAPVTPMPVRGRPVAAGILPGEWEGRPGPTADGRPAAPVKPAPGRPIPTKPIDQIRPPVRSTGSRQWGESRPGEMYPAVEGPGNPSWERRHPELAQGGQPAVRPRASDILYPGGTSRFDERTGRYVNPQDPRGQPGMRYPGGSPNFDERTGRYTTPPAVPQPGQPWRPLASPDTPATPRITIDGGGIAVPRTPGRELDPNVRQAIAGLQNMLDRLRGFST